MSGIVECRGRQETRRLALTRDNKGFRPPVESHHLSLYLCAGRVVETNEELELCGLAIIYQISEWSICSGSLWMREARSISLMTCLLGQPKTRVFERAGKTFYPSLHFLADLGRKSAAMLLPPFCFVFLRIASTARR
jgi:hypothetical protein